jgi:UDP-N-acetylmuramoyl-L-alanyl-D-glutamate--2,6-diaminopimelate ligase
VPAGPRPSTPPVPLSRIAAIASAQAPAADPAVGGVTLDSRSVLPGDLYAALPGFRTHGAEFAAQAAAGGAAALLTDPSGAQRCAATGLPVLVVEDPRAVLGEVSDAVYDHPSRDLVVVGITGTNGKTTTSYLVDAGLRADGRTTGLIGTVGTRIGDDVVPTVRTTPEAPDVHALLAVMRERGATHVTMEVSSHALVLGRVDGVRFATAGFTNLSPDHLDFHRDMDDYFAAKASLFVPGRTPVAVVCLDGEPGHRMAQTAAAQGVDVVTCAWSGPATWMVEGVVAVPGGSVMRALGPDGVDVPLEVRLPGSFNVANALLALALLVEAGVDPLVAADGIAACPGVPGRMERIADPDLARSLFAYVDYAHTPDAVERALAAAREVAEARAGRRSRIVAVLGAGGDRDPHKRADMGRAAAAGADIVVVTDDNPRSEDPAAIRAEVLRGAAQVPGTRRLEVPDRARAIRLAVSLASDRDVVLILGKGHEQGQEAAGTVSPFDDRVVLAEALAPPDEHAQPIHPEPHEERP